MKKPLVVLVLSIFLLSSMFGVVYSPKPITHIVINGNSGFTSGNGVSSGNGTALNPYIIQLYTFTADAYDGISISNTDAFFIVRNCTVNGNSNYRGIYLSNVTNGWLANNTISGNSYGISLSGSTLNNLTDNTVNLNAFYGIYLVASINNILTANTASSNANNAGISLFSSSSNNLTSNTVRNSTYGISLLTSSSNNRLTGNTCFNNTAGISIESSSNSLIGNNASNNTMDGIDISSCSNNTVAGNTATNNGNNGISFSSSSSNTITGNAASNNTGSGIYLTASSNNTVSNNTASNDGGNGISVYYTSTNNTFTGNTLTNNINGIHVLDSSNNTFSSNMLSNNTYYGIYLQSSFNNSIANNTVSNNYFGIMLNSSPANIVSDNTASNNENLDIYLYSSSDNTVSGNSGEIEVYLSNNNTFSGNTASDVGYGISLSSSSNNTITGNTCTNSVDGIRLYDSPNNTVSDNTFFNCDLFVYACNNTVTGNTVNGLPIIYFEGASNQIIDADSNAGEVVLVNCTGFTIRDLNINSSGQGIILIGTNSSAIVNNTFTYNWRDISLLENCDDAIIENNTFSYGDDGPDIEYSSNVTVANNTFSFKRYSIYTYELDLSTFAGNTFINSTLSDLYLDDSPNNLVTNNIMINCTGNEGSITLDESLNCIVADNIITNNSDEGIYLYQTSDDLVTGNMVNNTLEGIFFEESSNNTLTNNTLSYNDWGIWLDASDNNIIMNGTISFNDVGIESDYSANNTITGCNIYNNTDYGVYNDNIEEYFIVNATNNWWGSSDGPSGAGYGHGDAISVNVLYYPWLTLLAQMPFPEYLTKISTAGWEETPVIGLDSNGNVHVIWVSNDGKFLKYSMFDSTGGVLIKETTLNPCPGNMTYAAERPSMVVDSQNNVHVVFHGFYLYENITESGYANCIDLGAASEVIYLKFDPYLDDRSGDAADFFSITEIPETIISTRDSVKSRAANIAIDPSDRLHVSWFEGNSKDSLFIKYLTMNTTGSILVSETSVTNPSNIDGDWGEPEILADSNGNAHIIYCTDTDSTSREIWYTMIDGDTGNTLINETRITADDGHYSVRAFMDIDSQDMIHVIWHDKRLVDNAIGEHELFYSKLDPSLDDQSGDAADPNVISLVSEKMITTNDGYKSYLKHIAVDPSDNLHIVWVDYREYSGDGEGELYYEVLNSTGDPLTNETRITWFENAVAPCYWWDSSGRNPEIAVSAEHLYVVFNGYDPFEDGSDIYLLISLEPAQAQLSLVVRGEDDQIYHRQYNSTSSSWNAWNVLPSGATGYSPAAATVADMLYVVVRGMDGSSLWFSSVNQTDSTFSGWTLLSGSTPSAPALSSNGTALALTVRGDDDRIYYRFYTIASQTWTEWSALPSGTTPDTPAATLVGNALHIVVRGMDGNTLWYSNVDTATETFSGWTPLSGSTPSIPTLAGNSTNLTLVVRGGDDRIYYCFYNINTQTWTGWNALPSGTTLDSPAAAILQNTLCIAVRGSDGSSLWQCSIDLDTSAFSGWTGLSGSTPSKPTLTS